MARMIPSTIDPDIKSNAERTVFNWFSEWETTSGVVLHSLGIAHHDNNVFGEIDFVVVSSEGILCVEVKGGRVERKDGVWSFINRLGNRNTKHQGPFEQVQGNMNSLRSYLKKRLGSNDPIVTAQFACCVVMPDTNFRDRGPDIVEEVLFDSSRIKSEFNKFILQSYQYWKNCCREKHGFQGHGLSSAEISRTVSLLRGDFMFVPSMGKELDRTNEELLTLTDEQYIILESLSLNPRLIISGYAGTGKTLLAIEQCRRSEAANHKVLYLCFNRQIAKYVEYTLRKEEIKNITVSTFHALLMQLCEISDVKNENTTYYEKDLPEMFMSRFSDCLSDDMSFDEIVIDEGQDLLLSNYLLCIDVLLKNGLINGRWSFFYDSNQNIYNSSIEYLSGLRELEKYAVHFQLSVNCRNTKQIAISNWMVSNIEQTHIIRTSGYDVQYQKYSSLAEERKILIKCLRNLKAQGISLSDIVILSAYTHGNSKCCLHMSEIPSDIGPILYSYDYSHGAPSAVTFFTIQAFKGLESKIIILLDMDSFSDERRRLLNYVAISRARTMLYIMYDENAESERQQMMLSGYHMMKKDEKG